MANISPYQAVQKEERKANILKIVSICLIVAGFGIFACIAWSGSSSSVATVVAMLGLLTGIIGIKMAFDARNLKKDAELTFDVLAAASARYREMEEDSSSNVYRDTINDAINKLTKKKLRPKITPCRQSKITGDKK